MLIERIMQEMANIKQAGLAREIKDLQYLDAVTAQDRKGKQYLVFSSNNYLGLTFAPEVRQAAATAALRVAAATPAHRTPASAPATAT